VIVATGPLTSDALSVDIAAFVGQGHLYFYDAISPIVLADTIDRSKVFRASRWDRSLKPSLTSIPGSEFGVLANPESQIPNPESRESLIPNPESRVPGDYVNCPLTAEEYERFYDALVHAESATVHDFDKATFFEGCLPIEVMAHRGRDTLRFGPMKPVGLIDPRTT